MAATCIMKQVEERHVATEIIKCVWSPKMDLVAIANSQAQVSMHRLYWQRVWIINSPGENVKVKGLAWRPDSKVLAIGYSSVTSHLDLAITLAVGPAVYRTLLFIPGANVSCAPRETTETNCHQNKQFRPLLTMLLITL
ncbi:Anaphase-promoting complex subunit 4 [Penaeus vannamei]|uniref:Anaphase-promoting complex subunit 4 n=1 Tax=Penaeus vannamei TaxID=6689 RepID=A0A3R7QNL6_PENVA|nr:Anaphase-promoting complex subunit 4 [Penaeus vannamei]